MVVRGAPAIGIAAAYGYALAAARGEDLAAAERVLAESRPTAVNLGWALDEMRGDPSREHARAIHRDEVARCRAMAAHAAALLAPGTRALTHCNAGGLATGGYGSAVGALVAAWEQGLLAHVWVDETRPLLQGARLTAWELETAGDPAHRDRRLGRGVADGGGEVDACSPAPTGSPRTATPRTRSAPTRSRCSRATTGSRSTSSRRARRSTTRRATGAEIPIEERDPAEITDALRRAQPGLRRDAGGAVTAIVTEHGVHARRTSESLAAAVVAA